MGTFWCWQQQLTSRGVAVMLSDNVKEVLDSCQGVLVPGLLVLCSKAVHLQASRTTLGIMHFTAT